MATKIKRLSAHKIESIEPGFHADGGGLYLRVRNTGSRSWVLRYTRAGKVREIGLGPTHTRSLADARNLAEGMRRAIADGDDPGLLVRAQKDDSKDKVEAAYQRSDLFEKRIDLMDSWNRFLRGKDNITLLRHTHH